MTIEGIEDVDILEEKEMVAVQCKYYAKQNIIIRLLQNQLGLCLKIMSIELRKKKIRYKLYGKYQSGQDKYPDH